MLSLFCIKNEDVVHIDFTMNVRCKNSKLLVCGDTTCDMWGEVMKRHKLGQVFQSFLCPRIC